MYLKYVSKSILAAALFVAANGAVTSNSYAEEFSFTASNTTGSRITKILVSEDNATWGHFDLGGGIEPGATENLVWDQSTNGESCEQWVKAVFADGSESTAAAFDFCENDLQLDF